MESVSFPQASNTDKELDVLETESSPRLYIDLYLYIERVHVELIKTYLYKTEQTVGCSGQERYWALRRGRSGLKPWHCHSLAVQPSASHSASLNLEIEEGLRVNGFDVSKVLLVPQFSDSQIL